MEKIIENGMQKLLENVYGVYLFKKTNRFMNKSNTETNFKIFKKSFFL